MRKFTRTDTPDFLAEKWELWGERFYRNKTSNQSYKFQWPTIKKQPVNKLLEPLLAYQTQGHCSYCDRYPLRSREDSIDHFKPKSKREYHRIAFHWNNLYYCCPNCQAAKGEQFNTFLLRPDATGYSFEDYFIYSFNTHKIDPRPDLNPRDLRKAKETIRIFGLNDGGHPEARRISFERYHARLKNGDPVFPDDYAYRFLFE